MCHCAPSYFRHWQFLPRWVICPWIIKKKLFDFVARNSKTISLRSLQLHRNMNQHVPLRTSIFFVVDFFFEMSYLPLNYKKIAFWLCVARNSKTISPRSLKLKNISQHVPLRTSISLLSKFISEMSYLPLIYKKNSFLTLSCRTCDKHGSGGIRVLWTHF